MTEDAEKRFEKAMGKLFHSKLPSTPTSSTGTPSPKEPACSQKTAQLGQMSKGPSSSSRVSGLSPTLTVKNPKSISTSINSPSPVCRPWDRGDLMRRLTTFKSMTWFGKPKIIGPVNCARRGWVNVDVDLIACEACGGRLSFSTPPTWTQRQVESAAAIFSTKLDDGHKALCPWKGNECEEDLAHFPPTPSHALVESYRDRCDALLQLPALPVVCSSAIEEMKRSRAPQIDRLLAQPPPLPSAAVSRNSGKIYGIEIVGDESAATGANLYYQGQRLISLCGWELRLLPYVVDCEDRSTQPVEDACPRESSPCLVHVHSPSIQLSSKPGVNEVIESSQNKSVGIQRKPEPASVVLDCSLCGASVGMWAFSTVYRPLQLVTNGSLESQEICNKNNDSSMRGMSAASCVGGVSTSEVKGKEYLDDASEAMTSSCQKDVTEERILDLSLTIAGGLPPTKQSINSPSIIQQRKHGFHCSSEVGDWVTSESHEPRNNVQSKGNYGSSTQNKRENTESTDVDKEGIDTARSSKRKRMEASSDAVIGPYRSGKSFLLNQLLSLSCEEGFGVGHMRDTKTKGIWVWGKPLEMDIGGVRTSILFLDTEGFESVGKSNVYDDRIFALATIMSSVLIYNLPETVREADISRLSFAVELAQEFYGRVKGRDIAFQPAKLLWLIQRDFLEGKTVQQMVNEALQQVPNLTGNKNIEQVNQIRESLEIMGENSTAFSLPQPHLLRTKLCNLPDSDLDPSYIKRREELKGLVTSMIQPKMVRGKFLNGKEFVSFLEQILEALNKGDIPSTVSLVEVFNKGVVDQCLKLYNDMMSSVSLPLSEDLFREVHEESKTKVMGVFEEQRFGRHHAKTSVERLESEIQKIYANLYLKNEYESAKLCEGLYTSCEDKVDELQELRLPSMAKFNAGFTQCNRSFEEGCHGPSKAVYKKRIEKMLGKSRLQFIKDYNNRLFNWLVGFSLVMVVVGRFILKFFLVEAAAWLLFIFLETYTRIFWSPESLYYNPVWHLVVTVWENVVYSSVLDLDRWVIPLAWVSLTLLLFWRCYGKRKSSGGALLPLYAFQTGSSNPRVRRSD